MEKQNILVSIIIPIYNVKDYLEKCISSCLNQSLKDIEIILVDDGSTDGSERICDCYKKSNPTKIEVIHQANQGLTVSRKAGIHASKGKFVGFVDGDDWIDSKMYETLYELALINEAQIVTSGGCREYPDGRGRINLIDGVPEGLYEMKDKSNLVINNIFSSSISNQYYVNGSACFKIFDRELITEIIDQVDESIHGYADDNAIVVPCILNASKIYISKEVLYHHVERSDSATYSRLPNVYEQFSKVYSNIKKFVDVHRYSDILKRQLDEYAVCRIIDGLPYLLGNNYKQPTFFFDFSMFPRNSRIVIYGAGNVGKSYCAWLKRLRNIELVGWVDSDPIKCDGKLVQSIDNLAKMKYDYILIAINNDIAAKEIVEGLACTLDKEKIVWEKPQRVLFMEEEKFY
uniref:glycosyltransferase n=1 Tax=Clostridium sp. 12(A) TaxID=1163671 RepID=UPI000463324F|nr:glycosyltransferase [Clostridium sp. 12(A)]